MLLAGDQIVAMQWLIEQGGRLWELKTAYDAQWGRASPGRLLIWATLRDAFDRGIEAFEFLGAGDGQQAAWTTHSEPLDTLVWYPYSWTGIAAAGFDFARMLLRHARGST
jgi:CelD/BcsL family acetyltransferase involved in cellulose biosynthesis